jgi:hypothetical protein
LRDARLLCIVKYLTAVSARKHHPAPTSPMTPHLARRLLALAAVLGIAADHFLRADSWRAGFVVWVLLVLGVALTVSESFASERSDDASADAARSGAAAANARAERRTLFGAAAILALMLILRDAPLLYALDFFGFVVVLFLVAWRAQGRALAQLEPRDALIGVASAVAAGAGGAPMLAIRDSDVTKVNQGWRRSAKTFAIGSIAAMPVLLIVTGLLAESDPMFASFLEEVGTMLDTTLVGRVALIAVATWLTAGALRGAFAPVIVNAERLRGTLDLPFSAAAPVLGGLTLLLSTWIGLQIRAMFGGTEYIAATAGVTVAEYARRGFFELIVIAGIVLAVLLVVDDVLDRHDAAQRRSFRTLGQLLVALVGAVLISAMLRLSLYFEYFGLTDDRVLALAVLIWVALVLGWFAMTVLRGIRTRFAPGVLVISAMWLALINVANPERWVVEMNLRRAEAGKEFDVTYHAKLSGDAIPTLLREAHRLGAARAAELTNAIRSEWAQRAIDRADWRRWSLPFAYGTSIVRSRLTLSHAKPITMPEHSKSASHRLGISVLVKRRTSIPCTMESA